MQVNTTAVVTVSRGMNHVEGGWPKEVDHTEAEQVGRLGPCNHSSLGLRLRSWPPEDGRHCSLRPA